MTLPARSGPSPASAYAAFPRIDHVCIVAISASLAEDLRLERIAGLIG
jgi:hypothetical protein